MYLMARPSKTFLFNFLDRKLRNIHSETGLDAGSSDFKMRKMFRTKKYFGLDLNLDSLRAGVKKYENDPAPAAILGDLTKTDKLTPNSVDLIVSTNTIYQFDSETRMLIIKNLINLLNNNGKFVFDLTISEDLPKIKNILKANFKTVKPIYYKNFISRFYEKFFEKNGFFGAHPLSGSKFFKLAALVISGLEYLTCFFPTGNYQVIFFCDKKIGTFHDNRFDVSALPLIDKNIYNTL